MQKGVRKYEHRLYAKEAKEREEAETVKEKIQELFLLDLQESELMV